jgi:hypothetical protein
VECAFQGSKVFEDGGPFTDMFAMAPRDAKRDERLQTSGRLIGFRFMERDWALEPQTAFYDWVYISALIARKDLAEGLSKYSAFTDIEFNPEKSINCQAVFCGSVCVVAEGEPLGTGDIIAEGVSELPPIAICQQRTPERHCAASAILKA